MTQSIRIVKDRDCLINVNCGCFEKEENLLNRLFSAISSFSNGKIYPPSL
ncbi:MAG: hypothetical protein ACFFDF_16765 [Candidatus Odinarchaeota archaeon]